MIFYEGVMVIPMWITTNMLTETNYTTQVVFPYANVKQHIHTARKVNAELQSFKVL